MSYTPAPIDNSFIRLTPELEELVERLAHNIHELWAQERLREGWRYGPERDDSRKTTPVMVPYEQLPDSEKYYDRVMARETIKTILALGGKVEAPKTG